MPSADTVLACNNSKRNFLFSESSVSGEASDYVSTSFSSPINSGECEELSLSVSDSAPGGSYSGTLTVISYGYTASAELDLEVS